MFCLFDMYSYTPSQDGFVQTCGKAHQFYGREYGFPGPCGPTWPERCGKVVYPWKTETESPTTPFCQ